MLGLVSGAELLRLNWEINGEQPGTDVKPKTIHKYSHRNLIPRPLSSTVMSHLASFSYVLIISPVEICVPGSHSRSAISILA